MSKPDQTRIDQVLAQTLRLDISQREQFMRSACGDDTALVQEVTVRLERSVAADLTRTSAPGQETTPASDFASVDINPGDRLGPYTIMSELGVGGMGLVFLAKQREPIRRQVALKVIKLGMDTREVIARFESERQALAMMSHPNIAAVLDAGSTDNGRPYFVMEYVDGIAITEYCDNHRLSVDQRIALFIQACNGIQHAHQKGIIHRDIKPGNMLVTHHAGQASAKIIDFGIAKSTDQSLVENTFFTRFGVFVGTPNYMSPEQAGSNPLDIDTRTDVYSLGVLLYQLLAGAMPFETGTFDGKSLAEIQQIIRQVDPPLPGHRLRGAGPHLRKAAKRRGVEVRALQRKLSGELSWIVMRAMAKDRHYRYSSAQAFAEDLQRYLDNEPVIAGPISRLYRARKFVLRHKLLVGSASMVALTLIGGLLVSGWALLKAEKSRQTAETRAAVTQATNALLYELFVPESSMAAGASSNRSLDESIELMLGRLENDSVFSGPRFASLSDDKALDEVALSVRSLVADREALLGDFEAAAIQYQQAETLVLRVFGRNSPHWFDLRTRQARNRARLEPEQGAMDLEALLQVAIGETSENHRVALQVQLALAQIRYDQGQYETALSLLTRASAARALTGPIDELLDAQIAAATAQAATGLSRHPMAATAADRALTLNRALFGANSLQFGEAALKLARICAQLGQLERAEPLFRQALAINLEHFAYLATGSGQIQSELAAVLSGLGQIQDAEVALFELIQNLQELQTRDYREAREIQLIGFFLQLASNYFTGGRWQDSQSWGEQALERARTHVDAPHPEGVDEAPLIDVLEYLGQLYLVSGKHAEALVLFNEALGLLPMDRVADRQAFHRKAATSHLLGRQIAAAEKHLAAALDPPDNRAPALILLGHGALLEASPQRAIEFSRYASGEASTTFAVQGALLLGLAELPANTAGAAMKQIESAMAGLRKPGPYRDEPMRIGHLAISLQLVIMHLENHPQSEQAQRYRDELSKLSSPG